MPTLQPLRPIARRALAAQSDERLVRLLREGHAPAFEEIVRRYRGPLVGFAAAIVSAGGAEDVVQTSLTKAHSALIEDSREINLRPWLFAIVRNGALNAIRGEPRVDELDEALAAHSNPSEIAEQRDDLDRLVVAMCALPDAQRQALVKRELEGVGHGEIAAQLGTTATAVRGLIFRARTQVRNAMGALVPLPLLRTLLSQGTAIGAAGGGASAAVLGGAGAKGGAAIAAAVLALGTGIAIEGRKGDKDGDRSSVALAQGGGNGASRPTAGNRSTPSAPTELTSETGRSGDDSSSNSDRGNQSAAGGSAGSQGESVSDGGSSGSGHSGSSNGSGSGSESSGSGGGGHGSPTVPPPSDDDDSGHDGSGPSDGSDDHSDSDEIPEPPEVEDDSSGPSDEPVELDDNSSGPGGGEEEPSGSDDHGGHGED
jgi:RNA polymerase sigma factor (sigma-70 family)